MGLLLFICCGRKETQPMEVQISSASTALSSIDSLLWQRPDSALICLLPYFDTACRDVSRNVSENADDIILGDVSGNVSTANDWHYANLLLAELLYKNDNPQLNRTDLLQAVAYYDSLMCLTSRPPLRGGARRAGESNTHSNFYGPLFFLAARAHYINGVGYYEHDSVVEACSEYLKALEVMEDCFEEKELVGKKALFIAFTYTRLTDLFSDFYLHEQAIYFSRQSLPYYLIQENTSWFPARMLTEIGSHLEIMADYDSASYYYEQGIKVLSDTNNLAYRDIATHLASLSYKKGNTPMTALNRLKTLLTQSRSEQEFASRCLSIGEIYYLEHQFDSAWYYLTIVYGKTQSIGSKKQAAEWLAQIAETQGESVETIDYANFLIPFANQEENLSGTKTQLVDLYNTHRQTKLELRRQMKARTQLTHVLFVIGGLFAALLIICFLYQRKKRSHLKLKAQMEAEQHSFKVQQAALSGRLRQSNAALKAKNQTGPVVTVPSSTQDASTPKSYLEEPICQQILSACNDNSRPVKSTIPVSAYADIALDDTQKAQLKAAAMRHYGSLFEKLKAQYPKLKEQDLYFCYLCLLGLDNAQIAVLQQKTISTIWERENRLKRLFCSEDKVSVILNGFLIN